MRFLEPLSIPKVISRLLGPGNLGTSLVLAELGDRRVVAGILVKGSGLGGLAKQWAGVVSLRRLWGLRIGPQGIEL